MTTSTRPPIYVTDAELERLSDLAHAAEGREPAAVALINELTRACVTEEGGVPVDAVRMHDRVSFLHDGNRYDGFELVYPNEANIADRRISILTQVGAMLIGLQPGHAMTWTGPDGRMHRVEVLDVARAVSSG